MDTNPDIPQKSKNHKWATKAMEKPTHSSPLNVRNIDKTIHIWSASHLLYSNLYDSRLDCIGHGKEVQRCIWRARLFEISVDCPCNAYLPLGRLAMSALSNPFGGMAQFLCWFTVTSNTITSITHYFSNKQTSLKSISSSQNLATTKTKNNVEKLWFYQCQYIWNKIKDQKDWHWPPNITIG